MRDFFMKELISVKDNRKYLIVETLYFAKKPCTIQYLAQKNNTSIRSTKTYLDEIKSQLNDIGGTIDASSSGIVMKLPLHIGIDYFQQHLIRNSLGFKMLELLFFNQTMTSRELEEQLFVSMSSLSRLVSQLRKILVKHGLVLDSRPYQIKGDEFLIRKFYTKYFHEAYCQTEWPFQSISENTLTKLVQSFRLSDGMRIETLNFNKIRLFLAINIFREEREKSLFEMPLKNHNLSSSDFKNAEIKIRKWLNSLSFSEDFTLKYTKIFSYIYIYYYGSYIKSDEKTQHKNENINKIKESLDYLSYVFDLPSDEHSHLVHKLDELMTLYSYYNSTTGLNNYLVFRPRDYSLLDIFKSSYPLFYELAERELIEICKKRNLISEQINSEELMYFLISKWEQLSFHLYNNFSRCKILLYSHINYQHGYNIKALLDSKLEDSITTELFLEPLISESALESYDFDVLVSTGTLFLDIEQPIAFMPIKTDIESIKPLLNVIEKIKQNYKNSANQKISQRLKK